MKKAVAVALALAAGLSAKDRIALIEFFGYKGVDVDAVRRALPFHEGDARPRSLREQAREAVRKVTGRDATDVAQICCVGDADAAIFIGLPGESSRPFAYDAPPAGEAPPPRELRRLYERMTAAEMEAVRKGHGETDGRPGYRLGKDPKARAAQLALRTYALRHEDEIIRTLQGDRGEYNRSLAADALGYGERTPRQIGALVRAARDPNETVRNNATRALGEIVMADASAGAQIPPDTFIEMLRSGIWTDRNKAAFLLMAMTDSRDPKLLARLKAEASDALEEMARWRNEGWSFLARTMLDRIKGR